VNEASREAQAGQADTLPMWVKPEVTRFSAGLAEGGDSRAGDAGNLS